MVSEEVMHIRMCALLSQSNGYTHSFTSICLTVPEGSWKEKDGDVPLG